MITVNDEYFEDPDLSLSGMPALSSCWSPCFWHMNVREGTYAVAAYTIVSMSQLIMLMCYLIVSPSAVLPDHHHRLHCLCDEWRRLFTILSTIL